MKNQTILTVGTMALLSMAGLSHVYAQPSQPAGNANAATTAPAITDVKNVNCPIGGESIDPSVKGPDAVHRGYRVGLCCNGCKKKFASDPDKYLKAAIENANAANSKKKQ